MRMSQDNPQIDISNGPIHATLYLPDAATGYYRGTRFDWSGVIASLKYEGHNYYGPWFDQSDPGVHDFVYRNGRIVAGPCSAMTGPAEEFSTSGKALGYDEAGVGGTFIKIGVGVLRKPDEADYDEYRLYEIVDPGRWTVRNGPSSVEFVQELRTTSGFGYRYRKIVRISADEPVMFLAHSLENTGRRLIESSVYNHNFLVLDGQAPGPDFRVLFPFKVSPEAVVYLKELQGEDCLSADLQGFGDSAQDYDFRIENRRVGAGMRITADRPLKKLALWSIRSVLSLEPSIGITVQPESEFEWTIAYRFYTRPTAGSGDMVRLS